MTYHDEERADALRADLPQPAEELLTATEWADLEHAYGSAEGTPHHLRSLLDEDPEAQAEALGMLEMSVLHQGSLYSSTPPAALFIAAILDHPRTLAEHVNYFPWDDRTPSPPRRPARLARPGSGLGRVRGGGGGG